VPEDKYAELAYLVNSINTFQTESGAHYYTGATDFDHVDQDSARRVLDTAGVVRAVELEIPGDHAFFKAESQYHIKAEDNDEVRQAWLAQRYERFGPTGEYRRPLDQDDQELFNKYCDERAARILRHLPADEAEAMECMAQVMETHGFESAAFVSALMDPNVGGILSPSTYGELIQAGRADADLTPLVVKGRHRGDSQPSATLATGGGVAPSLGGSQNPIVISPAVSGTSGRAGRPGRPVRYAHAGFGIFGVALDPDADATGVPGGAGNVIVVAPQVLGGGGGNGDPGQPDPAGRPDRLTDQARRRRLALRIGGAALLTIAAGASYILATRGVHLDLNHYLANLPQIPGVRGGGHPTGLIPGASASHPVGPVPGAGGLHTSGEIPGTPPLHTSGPIPGAGAGSYHPNGPIPGEGSLHPTGPIPDAGGIEQPGAPISPVTGGDLGGGGGGTVPAAVSSHQYTLPTGSNPWYASEHLLHSQGNTHPTDAQIGQENIRMGQNYFRDHKLGRFSWARWKTIAKTLQPGTRLRG